MKITFCFYAAFVLMTFAGCSTQSVSDQTATSGNPATPATEGRPVSIVIWNEVGVRATPEEKGKYVTSVYLGELLQLPGDTASEVSGSKLNHYHKVVLSDGKSGWVRDEFIAVDVYPAAVIKESPIYKRPDLVAISDKVLMPMDFAVAKKSSGEWTEVKAKKAGDKWYTSGYVKTNTLSFAPIDVQFVTLRRRVAEETKADLKQILETQLADENIFSTSALWASEYGRVEEEDPMAGSFQQLKTPEAGLYAYLPLNGDGTDIGGSENYGTLSGATPANDMGNAANGAMYFNGESFITLNNPSAEYLKPPLSVAAYFMLENPAAINQCVVSRGRSSDGTGFNFGYTVTDDNRRIFYLGFIGSAPIGAEAPANIEEGEWVFLAGTFDMKEAKLYVNGELVDTQAISEDEANAIFDNLANSSEPIEIGRELSTLDRYFRGTIDDVVIYKRALTAEEIAAMMSNRGL
jgi:hypothetical protein